MVLDYISGILTRDLQTLRNELEAYKNEQDMWQVPPGITNSAGNLAMHLAGNLLYFIGAQLGGTGYVRNRDAEFSRKDVPRKEILEQIEAASAAVERTLAKMSDKDLIRPYRQPVGSVELTTGDFLIHLAAHFTYHLGQIDYHRRIVTGDGGPVRALAVAELKSAKPAK